MRLLTLILLLFTIASRAAHTEADLLLAAKAAAPGSTVMAGVRLRMEPGWHTYWKNPGAAGQATEIQWNLPAGITAGDIQWPVPEKIPPTDITTYGYEHETVLIVPLTIGKDVAQGSLKLSAMVSWLECKESCIPAKGEVQADLLIAGSETASTNAAFLAEWQAKTPVAKADFAGTAWWEKPTQNDSRILDIQWPGKPVNADLFPEASDDYEIQGATETLTSADGLVHIRKLVKKFSGDWPKEISGVFTADGKAVQGRIVIGTAPESTTAATINPPAPPQRSLWMMLLYAFIGGLILNIMPCVLPVIALKILGFVNESQSKPGHVRVLGLVYGVGVLFSFLVLAILVIGVKAAGHKAGWGMQFGNPVFLVCLTTLVTLVAMNLFGIFEVTLGGRAMDSATELSTKSGLAGAFFNGVLATALATPCTAPFLSIALGFAFAQGAAVILLVFAAVAAGLASPYVLLSWNPSWLKFLPRPGAWMEKFKMAMAFPMLLTAVWLFHLTADNYGDRTLWLGVFLVIVAAAAWVFGEFVQRGRNKKGIGVLIVLLLLVGGYTYALEKQLRWREPVVPSADKSKNLSDGIDWQPWSPEALMQARATGRPVLVDFTADWCLTCQVNKRTSIEIPSVREKIKELNAVTLLADYTHFPDAITSELNHFNRAGVPLVLVYPNQAVANPIVLPEVLTPSIVLSALNQSTN